MRSAAQNEGTSSTLMGAGMGLGMGFGVGGAFGQGMQNIAQTTMGQMNQTVPMSNAEASSVSLVCKKCGQELTPGAKFCLNCGEKVATGNCCPECGATIPAGAKFCPECGATMQKVCSNCGNKLMPGAKFCPECGTPQ